MSIDIITLAVSKNYTDKQIEKASIKGEDGFSPIATVTQTDSGAVISITDKDGTTTATITNGKDGADGQPGKDGADGAKGDKGDKGDTGASGKDGTSVTVKSVSESTADGGSNVVTFSDGKTLIVKNGSKGSKGDKGDTGAAGEKGEQGIQGIQGEKGDKGDTGSQGPAGADGKTPVRGTDYWTDADQKATAQAAVESLTSTAGIINPDTYGGTDSQKLQASFDALATSGGIISINRIYKLTDNIYVSHDSSAHNNLITVAGVGKQAGIDFGAYCFQGADSTKRSYGGIIFKDLWLSGTSIGFNCTYLIRLTFDNCMIRNFSNFLYCTDCLQSVYIMGCYIRASASGVADGSIKEAIKSTTVCDLKIIGCVCEQGYGLLNVTNSMDGCSITDSCIEGYKSIPIVLPVSNRAVNISNNYFEANNGTNIDATATTGAATISICNNLFCEYHNEDEYSGVIKLPVRIDNGYINVSNNHCNYAYTVLLLVPDGATDLSKVYAFGNYGATNDTSGLLKMVEPADIHKAMKGIVKGVDYWTDADKEEMVEDVLAEMSGETWQFELANGTKFERTVATASLTEFTSESWTFTLSDGSTVIKEVSIV